jgi:hypothetical protein
MRTLIALTLLIAGCALAGEVAPTHMVDLRAPGALEQLQRSNPQHFEKIQRVLSGLAEEPKRAEGNWLKVEFDARDVDLSRQLIKTSNPPKQLLQFTLDDTRYELYVVRSDLGATIQPLRSPERK